MDKISYKQIVDNINDGLYFVNRDRVITYWNKAAERISGFSAEEVVGRSCADNILSHVDVEGNNLCVSLCPLMKTIEDGEIREAEIYLHHKSGRRVPVLIRSSRLVDVNGDTLGGVELFTDISNFETNALRVRELEKLALLDNLTELANRHYLENEIWVRFEEQKRNGIPFGILFIDIDLFKSFNDTYGHDIGDRVLKYVAGTFVANARPFDLFGRWGGEEFVAIIRNVSDETLREVSERVRALVEYSYLVHDGRKLSVTVSVGATLARPGDTLESLIKRADDLLYLSKKNGRNRVTTG